MDNDTIDGWIALGIATLREQIPGTPQRWTLADLRRAMIEQGAERDDVNELTDRRIRESLLNRQDLSFAEVGGGRWFEFDH